MKPGEVMKKPNDMRIKKGPMKRKKKNRRPNSAHFVNPKAVITKAGETKRVDYPNTRPITLGNVMAAANRRENPRRHLSNANFINKRDKGLCFR